MGVGRSTIREALAVLVADGVAVRVPNKGVAVKELSAQDVADISLARASPRGRPGYGAGPTRRPRSSGRPSERRSTPMPRWPASTEDPAALTEAHLQIHRALVGLTGSDRLLAAADAYSGELRLGLAHLDRVRGNIAEQVESHRELRRACSRPATSRRPRRARRAPRRGRGVAPRRIGHGTIEP